MSSTSRYFEILDHFMGWNSTSTHKAFDKLFGEAPDQEDLEKRTQEYEIGNFKTTVTTFFDADGMPRGTITQSKGTIDLHANKLEELKSQLQKAVEQEDYEKAAEIKKKIKDLPPSQETK
jgi:excinuclease UvrABC nuclease subunit